MPGNVLTARFCETSGRWTKTVARQSRSPAETANVVVPVTVAVADPRVGTGQPDTTGSPFPSRTSDAAGSRPTHDRVGSWSPGTAQDNVIGVPGATGPRRETVSIGSLDLEIKGQPAAVGTDGQEGDLGERGSPVAALGIGDDQGRRALVGIEDTRTGDDNGLRRWYFEPITEADGVPRRPPHRHAGRPGVEVDLLPVVQLIGAAVAEREVLQDGWFG